MLSVTKREHGVTRCINSCSKRRAVWTCVTGAKHTPELPTSHSAVSSTQGATSAKIELRCSGSHWRDYRPLPAAIGSEVTGIMEDLLKKDIGDKSSVTVVETGTSLVPDIALARAGPSCSKKVQTSECRVPRVHASINLTSITVSDCCRKCGLPSEQGRHKTVKKHIDRLTKKYTWTDRRESILNCPGSVGS